jgi:hypothetical protein
MANPLLLILSELIGQGIQRGVSQAADNPHIPLAPKDAPRVAQAAIVETVQQVRNHPQIQEMAARIEHVTNNEPWYQSRVTWGAIVGIGTGLLGALGMSLDSADQAQLIQAGVGAGAVISGLITLYGRWAARKPLGQ